VTIAGLPAQGSCGSVAAYPWGLAMDDDVTDGIQVGTVYKPDSPEVTASTRLLSELLNREVPVRQLTALAGPNEVVHWIADAATWTALSAIFGAVTGDVRSWLAGKVLDAGVSSVKRLLDPKAQTAVTNTSEVLRAAIENGDTVHFGIAHPKIFRGGAAYQLEGATETEILALVKILDVIAKPVREAIDDYLDWRLALDGGEQGFVHVSLGYPKDGVLRVQIGSDQHARTLEFPFDT